MKALVIGAGIGGLTAALALLRKGVDVEVYERAAELTETGAGLHCSPNGTRVLIALGLARPMAAISLVPKQRDVRLWNTGRVWPLHNHGATAAERYGAPYVVMHRGDLHAMLADAVREARPGCIHVNAGCVEARQDGTRVIARLHDGTVAAGDLLIAADGVHSEVRRQLFGTDQPSFTGVTAWRGLVPIERVPHISPDTTTNWIGPDGSITIYGVRAGRLLNFVGMKSSNTWRAESWTERGTQAECLADFQGWHEDVLKIIRNIDVPYRWGLFLHEPVAQWSRGRISLLGDACHAMLPFLGQGANMALEDAMVLSRCLDEYSDVEAALKRYELARKARADRVVQMSSEQGKRVRTPILADPQEAARYVETQWSPQSVRTWYDWIFDYDALTTPI